MRDFFHVPGALARVLFVGAVLLGLPGLRAQELPPVQVVNGVSYLSGGIGLDESTAIKAESAKWPLTLLFAARGPRGEVYVANVQVRILDVRGAVLLDVVSEGPYLLVRLSPGSYTVEATRAGKTQRRTVQLPPGKPVKAGWSWPETEGETGL